MKTLAAIFLLASCNADRWNTSVARGDGEIAGPKSDFDTEELTLEVGISGPIGSPPERRYPVMPAWTPEPASAQQAPVQGTDWGEMSAAITGAVGIALALVKLIPSDKFKGPFDKKVA